MGCMRAQTRPRFILPPERVGEGGGEGGEVGIESEPMLTSGENALFLKNSHQRRIEPTTLYQGQRAHDSESFRPPPPWMRSDKIGSIMTYSATRTMCSVAMKDLSDAYTTDIVDHNHVLCGYEGSVRCPHH